LFLQFCRLRAAPAGNGEPTLLSNSQELEVELIRRIRSGERELFYQLVQPYERSVYFAAFSILQNEADAEEVSQETMLKALRAIDGFRGDSKFSTWLVAISVNEARMRQRKARQAAFDSIDAKEQNEDGEYAPRLLTDWREIPSEALERKELREEIVRALASIPADFREVCVLRDIRHLSTTETAQILGISEALVKTRLLRARLRLRDWLAPKIGSAALSRPFEKGRKPW
jgi:RNA polymerase sigma-70 factor (ECF subfamily)